MSGKTWWDDAAIVLLANTGDLELAEQFARWCESAHEGFAQFGIRPEDLTE